MGYVEFILSMDTPMRHWRALFLCLMMAWLPMQVLASQFAPCPHSAEEHALHHSHHHDHHASQGHHAHDQHYANYCPDCDTAPAGQTGSQQSALACDQCQCCTLIVGMAVLPLQATNNSPPTEHWAIERPVPFHSQSPQPALRPPLALV